MKMFWLQMLMPFVVLAILTADGTAKDKHLPLPPQVMTAKTVYIDNQSGIAKLGDRCFQQIQKWGRFQVIQDRRQADLVLLLSAREFCLLGT